jgi:outer membrane lipoprotein-sorting protein
MRAIAVGVGVALGVCAAGAGAEAFSVSYDQTVTQGRQVMTGKVSMKDKMFRIDMTAEGQATATLHNASGTYTYMPAEGMAMKLPGLNASQRPIEHADNYAQYLQEQHAELIGTDTVDGHPCEMYRFTDPDTGDLVTAWVWTEKQFPIKMEFDDASGKILVEIRNIQLGAALPDALFELPADVQVMDMGNMFQMGE